MIFRTLPHTEEMGRRERNEKQHLKKNWELLSHGQDDLTLSCRVQYHLVILQYHLVIQCKWSLVSAKSRQLHEFLFTPTLSSHAQAICDLSVMDVI